MPRRRLNILGKGTDPTVHGGYVFTLLQLPELVEALVCFAGLEPVGVLTAASSSGNTKM